MSTTNTSIYMEHPLVRAYLRDLDTALGDAGVREAGEIKESIREHLVSEFALRQAAGDAPVGMVVEGTLDKLGPVKAIVSGLTEENDAERARAIAVTRRRTVLAVVTTALSVALVPVAAGVSALLSVVALVLAVRGVSSRARTPLIVINALVLVVALAYLVIALTTASLLSETVQGTG